MTGEETGMKCRGLSSNKQSLKIRQPGGGTRYNNNISNNLKKREAGLYRIKYDNLIIVAISNKVEKGELRVGAVK